MKYDPQKHHRRSIRLKGYDYSQPGWYFVTLCTQNREMLFGDVVNGKMVLNSGGKIAKICWVDILTHFSNVDLDKFIIMPNHVHGIIHIIGNNNVVGVQDFEPLRKNKYQKIIPYSLGSIIRGFKTGVTKWFRKNTDIYNVWQRNYYERIIRNEPELNRIQKYIVDNPAKWQKDKYY